MRLRRLLWLVMVVALCVPLVMMSGCTEEAEANIEQGADGVAGAAQTVSPWLPEPAGSVVQAVGWVAAGIGAWMARRRGKRAKALAVRARNEAERAEAYAIQLSAEMKAKVAMANAGTGLTGLIDEALTDPKVRPHALKVLEGFDKYKSESPWLRTTVGVLDSIRKGYTTLDALTESMKAPDGGQTAATPVR